MSDGHELVSLPVDQRLLKIVASSRSRLLLVSPFVTQAGIDRLGMAAPPKMSRLVTRLEQEDVENGVMDPDALDDLKRRGFQIRLCGDRLHAKCWIIDDAVFIGSVNLTESALRKNIELLVQTSTATATGNAALVWTNDLWETSRPLTDEDLELARLWKRSARFRRPLPRLDSDDPDAAQPTVTDRFAWIHVGGRGSIPEPETTPIRDFAELESAATFPVFPKGTYRGAPVFHVHSAKRILNGRKEKGWAIIGWARLRAPVRRVDPTKLRFLKERVTPEGWKEIQRYHHLGWLVNARFIDAPMGAAPFLKDVRRPDGRSIVGKTSALRLGFSILDRISAATMEATIEEAISHHGVVSPRSDDVIWWNHYLRDGVDEITRTEIDAALDDSPEE